MDSGRTSRSRVLYGSRSSSLSLLVTSLVRRVTKKSLSAMSALVYANKRGVTEARSCVNGNAPLLHISLSKRIINGASFRRRVINEAPVLTSHYVYPRWPVGTDSKGILNYGWLQSMLNIQQSTFIVWTSKLFHLFLCLRKWEGAHLTDFNELEICSQNQRSEQLSRIHATVVRSSFPRYSQKSAIKFNFDCASYWHTGRHILI